jgi:hypothetical protein
MYTASILSGWILYSIHYLKVFASFFYRHAHPGSPYVFGLAEVDHDVEFPDPMPVVGKLRLDISIQQLQTFSSAVADCQQMLANFLLCTIG